MSQPIVMLLPAEGFDPTEAAIPWKVLTDAGERVLFATPTGEQASADPIMVTGEGLDLWGALPLLKKVKLVGLALRADRRGRAAWQAMISAPEFRQPLRYSDIKVSEIDGLVLPGGHAKTMRPYLESELVQKLVADCLATGAAAGQHLPVAAICHGVVVLARASDGQGRSVIAGRKVTGLPWSFEKKAWQLNRVFRFWDPHYYRTYLEEADEPAGYRGVEQEVRRALGDDGDFVDVPAGDPDYRRKTDGMHRDTPDDPRPAWVVRDGNLVTARWPGDAHQFAKTLLEAVHAYREPEGTRRYSEVL